MVQDNMELI